MRSFRKLTKQQFVKIKYFLFVFQILFFILAYKLILKNESDRQVHETRLNTENMTSPLETGTIKATGEASGMCSLFLLLNVFVCCCYPISIV